MRMYRILTLFLIAGFVLSTSACSYKRVKTVPDPKVNYTIEIEEGDVQLVVPCGKGFIYTTDLNELVIVDENGDAIGHHSFDNTIIDVYSDGNGIIMIALDNAEVLNCSFDNNEFIVKDEYFFQDEIADISYFDSYDSNNEMTYYVVLDDGKLYTYGKNLNCVIHEGVLEDYYLYEPIELYSDIRIVYSHYAVSYDNKIIDLKDNMVSEPLEEEIVDINSYFQTVIVTPESFYFLDSSEMSVLKKGEIDRGQFYCSNTGYMYVQNGEMYYTGLISGEPVGKSVPESNEQIIDIPNGYDYCVIQYGIVCFSDDTIICYSL